jgi:wobble nucleotide-excising tRNase
MITKFKAIGNFAVFKGFIWDKAVLDALDHVCHFKDINILYGRNYSGKTSLSRILRAIETGALSEKFENPAFTVSFADGIEIDQSNLNSQGKKIRVFNEDFVRENLRFITNPDDSIEPFAILGNDNNKIEKEIQTLETELGSKEEKKETGLYAQQIQAMQNVNTARGAHQAAQGQLDKQFDDKATDRKIGIKYKPDRFGDQNYDIRKLRNDIKTVQNASYQVLTNEQQVEYEKLINENKNDPIPSIKSIDLHFSRFAEGTEALVTRKISESDKIEELVKDAVLNRWVNEGRKLHKDKHENCVFCGNTITENRWVILEKHFDEESDLLEKNIDALITEIEGEKTSVSSAFTINKYLFYSTFHKHLDGIAAKYKTASGKYNDSLDYLLGQLKARKDDIINTKELELPADHSSELIAVFGPYEAVCIKANDYTNTLSSEQTKARDALRLREVVDFIATIKYTEQLASIAELKNQYDEAYRKKDQVDGEIANKELLIESKKRELNDEEKGAIKVNEYMNNFFGNNYLSLEAKKHREGEPDLKRIRFEVIRDGKKAYHLSEGECSLLAFCYYLAKLEDVDTKGTKPIIWIDDPISSLDGNHIFFVYSLLNAEIVSKANFAQFFISTHNLDFLKYLKRLNGKFLNQNSKLQEYGKAYFVVYRQDKISTINLMPKYLKEYITEFNYLFHQIYKCASIEVVDDTNYTTFYNFGNNARKFLEIYLYYKYPDASSDFEKLQRFFGGEKIPSVLTDRINNEYSHLSSVFERGATPVEVPEMKTVAQKILDKLKTDEDQYGALLQSVGVKAQDAANVGGGA